MNFQVAAVTLAALTVAATMPAARASNLAASPEPADTIMYDQSDLVIGTQANEATLNLQGPGELILTITDAQFPNAFASLQIAVTDSAGALIGLTSADSVSLPISGPTTVYADVFATAQGSADVGLYNLTATFVPVPLPQSWALFAAGIVLTSGWIIRRRKRAIVIKGMA
jgi:hypothetical protein